MFLKKRQTAGFRREWKAIVVKLLPVSKIRTSLGGNFYIFSTRMKLQFRIPYGAWLRIEHVDPAPQVWKRSGHWFRP